MTDNTPPAEPAARKRWYMRWWVWAIVAFVLFLGLAVLLLSVNYLLAFAGFLGMFATALYIERNLRRVGRAGMQEATHAIRRNSLRDYIDNAGNKARDRLRREDESED